jgi:hypothetical protein
MALAWTLTLQENITAGIDQVSHFCVSQSIDLVFNQGYDQRYGPSYDINPMIQYQHSVLHHRVRYLRPANKCQFRHVLQDSDKGKSFPMDLYLVF